MSMTDGRAAWCSRRETTEGQGMIIRDEDKRDFDAIAALHRGAFGRDHDPLERSRIGAATGCCHHCGPQ
jgi:hypothetical protein